MATTNSEERKTPLSPSSTSSSSSSSSSLGSPGSKRKHDEILPTLRVGGVPEHFNLPWHLAQERGLFDKQEVKVEWTDVKEGTGAMLKLLKEGKVDLIIALTEGLISDIAQGSNVRLLGTYVESPLCWAISTGSKSKYTCVEELRGTTFGISRFTSGSHLMTCVLANNRGWDVEKDVAFAVKGSFQNLRDAVNDGSCSAFMWETFTTKPFHDSGEVRRIGDITTPWPCFMIASTTDFLNTGSNEEVVKRALAAVREACGMFRAESKADQMPREVARRYGLKHEDALEWYQGVVITATPTISYSAVGKTLEILREVKVLKPESEVKIDISSLVDSRFVRLLHDIKSMRLYNKPELVTMLFSALRNMGKADNSALDFKELLPYDQHHYDGTRALDECAKLIGLSDSQRLLNIGSGLGGCARYFAGTYGCEVLAVELQQDLHSTASELTNRCGERLASKVHHVGGDFLQIATHLQPAGYDAIVSWLTILHFDETQRPALLRKCLNLLRPGGYFFADDFFQLRPITQEEREILAQDVFCRYIPPLAKYKADLVAAGFELVSAKNMTAEWHEFTKKRAHSFASTEGYQAIVKAHGAKVADGLSFFYGKIEKLFSGGNVGGVRVLARKPTVTHAHAHASGSNDHPAVERAFSC